MYRYLPNVFRTILFCLLAHLFTCLTSLAATEQDKYLLVYYRQSASGNYDFYAKNLNYCPYQLQVEFSKLISAEVTTALPYYTIIGAQSNEQYLFSIRPKDETAFSFKFAYNYWLGDPTRVISGDNQPDYVLPYRAGTSLKVTQGYNGPYSHKGTYALDFELIESTAICAAKDGVVVQTKEDSKRGGPDKAFARDCNYITVYQTDGTIAEYVHLKHNGSIVSVGDTIFAGQVIGYGGNTGWSTSPHLHFCVKQPVKMGYESIPVKFLSSKSKRIALETNRTYRAYLPGKYDQPVANSWRNLFGLLAHSSNSLSE